ncbi:MAG: tetratricopeptide repeat protein [Acidobacteriota bacterium]|nr:tetratricopeptide repeat protein [Acidobacteriota bacterium]
MSVLLVITMKEDGFLNSYLTSKVMRLMSLAISLGLALGLGSSCLAVQATQSGESESQTSEPGQTTAKSELREGLSAFKNENYREAQRHFEKSLALNPMQKNVPFLIARAIHAQYRLGVDTPENNARAREAIAAYQKVLIRQPDHDEAYNAVASIYGSLGDEGEQRAWILRRANNPTVPKEKRSAAYTVLANMDWNCARKITEQPDNKQTTMRCGQTVVQFKKSKEQRDFGSARECATRGLELVGKAISLHPESEPAWSVKHKLLLEMAKQAEIEGNASLQRKYAKQAVTAQSRMTELSEQNRKKMEAVKSY